MTTPLAPYPDVEKVLGELLAPFGTCGSETPLDLQSELPYIRVARTGDWGSDRVTDRSIVSVDVFAADADDAKAIAAQVQQLLLTGLPAPTALGDLDYGRSGGGPFLVPPTDSDNLRQVTASYNVSMRRSTP